ncbi:hypothetical protein Q1695_000876 [Nippostrongylus brasiliensis]|nr:hypothetical protein Q1695_000876 [Nippostrongylus brasiliensis]
MEFYQCWHDSVPYKQSCTAIVMMTVMIWNVEQHLLTIRTKYFGYALAASIRRHDGCRIDCVTHAIVAHDQRAEVSRRDRSIRSSLEQRRNETNRIRLVTSNRVALLHGIVLVQFLTNKK